MQPYQEEYIKNCRAGHALSSATFSGQVSFHRAFSEAMENMRKAQVLALRNTHLIRESLLPVLDDIFNQDEAVLRDLEDFADALTAGPQALDMALACQLHTALLSRARRLGSRDDVIRELYKLGMARFAIFNVLTGIEGPEVDNASMQMRFCFVEAASFLKYFEDFDRDDTKGYILRSLANIYLGTFNGWEERLACVRRTMEVFTDERYRSSAPDLPWGAYMRSVHRQMTTVLPYSFSGGALSPDAVADIMDSAHFVYAQQLQAARESGNKPHPHVLFPYFALEFGCGILSSEEFLSSVESLLDEADPQCYDEVNLYLCISLPVYYVQYLRQIPDSIPPRQSYITHLYRRTLSYVQNMPSQFLSDQVRLYVRQALSVFIEVEGGVTYRQFTLDLMAHFAPDLYAHGCAVGWMAQAICQVIWKGDPGVFSDLPALAQASTPEERGDLLSQFAFLSGLFHDVGRINFAPLRSQAGRQQLSSEEALLRIHTSAGASRLSQHPSTRDLAHAALGHHCWYDGSDGYPDAYRRKENPYRAIVDVVAFADFLDDETEEVGAPIRTISFEEKIAQATQLEGRRFSPLVTGWLHDPALLGRLKELYDSGRQEGYRLCLRHRLPHRDQPDLP